MNGSETKNPLGYEKIFVLLRRFAVPSIVAMLVSSLYNIVDQIFIGNSVGYLGNAATNVAYPLTTICLALSLLIGVGSASRFSIELGKGDGKEAELAVSHAVWMAAVLGTVYAILVEIFAEPLLLAFGGTPNVMPYAMEYVRYTAIGMPFLIFTNVMSNLIRADGSPGYSMMCMVVGAVVNTVLDPIFIFVFDKGVAGAAIATMISQVISCGIAVGYLWKFKQIRLKASSFRLSIRRCMKNASYGLSNSLNQVALTVLQIVLNNSLTYYGAMSIYGSDIPLSAAGIVMKVNGIMISLHVGLHQGSQPIIGFNYGAKQYDRVKAVYKLAVKWALIFGAMGFVAFQFFPKYVIGIFGTGDELYFNFTVKFLRTFLFMALIAGVQILSANFFSAIGKPLKGIFLSLSRQFFFLIPLIVVLPIFFGVEGLLYAGPVSDGISVIICVLFILREFRRMNRETEQMKIRE